MLDSKIDIFKKEWLDVVFDHKNKNYGAYQLRRQNSSNTSIALFFTSSAFILLFLLPKIISLIKGPIPEDQVIRQVEIVIQSPPAINPKTPPPAPVEPPASKKDQVKFLPPIVVSDPMIHDDQPLQIEDLKDADPGQKTIAGVPDGNIVIADAIGKGPKQAAIVEDQNVYETINLESQPAFPGGIDKFYAYLGKTIRYPAMAQEKGIQGSVFVSFVVEKNGDLTDIQVVGKLGGGTDEEAIRVLKASPRWIPGIQNGRPVRVKYNIPIKFSIQ